MQDHITIKDLSVRYGATEALRNINLAIPRHSITSIFGPANSGKTTLLRAINRLIELTPEVQRSGDVLLDNQSVYRREVNLSELRRRVAMVFATPSPLPMSIFDNLAYGLRLAGERRQSKLMEQAEYGLRAAALWNEVQDRLNQSAMSLSGGQQQRLCLARGLALEPEVLLLDAPTAALDPISTAQIEETLVKLKRRYTIVLVPHNQQQGSRVGDQAAFFLNGECVETGSVGQLFTAPRDQRTEDYVTGRFG